MRAAKHRTDRPSADQHVALHPGGGWAITATGGTQATSVHRTQKAAIQHAKELARRLSVALVVHGRDGRVRLRRDYGERRQAELLVIADEIVTRHRETYAALAKR